MVVVYCRHNRVYSPQLIDFKVVVELWKVTSSRTRVFLVERQDNNAVHVMKVVSR